MAVPADQPLIGVLVEEGSRNVVQYSTDLFGTTNGTADARLQAALSVIGAWSDLDWEALSTDLDRIRHQAPPTPPIEL